MPSPFFNSAIVMALLLSQPPNWSSHSQRAAASLPNLPVMSLPSIDRPHTLLAQAPMNTPAKQQADKLLKQGIQQLEANDLTAAIASWQQALTLYQQLGDKLGQGKTLNNLGYAYSAQQAWEQAISAYQQSLAIAEAINNPAIKVNALAQLGRAYDAIGKPADALKSYQQALLLAQQLKNQPGEAAITGGIALAYETLKDYRKALEYYQRWLKLAQVLGDATSAASAQASIERVQRLLKSSSLDNPLQQVSDKADVSDVEADRLLQAGIEQFSQSQFAAATPLLEQALQRYRTSQNQPGTMQALVTLGSAYLYQEQFVKAIAALKPGLELARTLKDIQQEEQALNNLSVAYFSVGEFKTALTYAQQLLQLAQQRNHRDRQYDARGGLGSAYAALGDYNRAIQEYEQQATLARQLQDPFREAVALSFLGDAYLGLEQGNRAVEVLQRGLKLAKAMPNAELTGLIVGGLGRAYAVLKNYTTALPYLKQSLESERANNSRLGEALALNNLGNVLFLLGRHSEAESYIRKAIDLWETQRSQLGPNDSFQISIFEAQALTYQTLQQILIARQKPLDALEVSERGRARAFVELLKSRRSPSTMQPPLSILPPNIEQIRQIAKQHNATLVQYSTINDNTKLFIPGTADSPRKNVYRALFIWVVKPTGEVTFRQADLTANPLSLDTLVDNTRQAIGVRSRATLIVRQKPNQMAQTNRLQQLHTLLIAPIADLLPSKPSERVIFVPQGELFLVPFAALQANDKYLIEHHTLLTVPSIEVLSFTQQQRQATRSASDALILGNPVMPKVSLQAGAAPEQLADLPGAAKEAIAIAPLLHTQAITGSEGTKATIVQKMPQARIIHLATHGLLDDVRGLGSAIALAPDPDKPSQDQFGRANGLLTAEEIFDLKLSADLVVLSACDTGRGRITGDGVIGLSRSFIAAGVPSLIVSLWAVPDAPTAELMTAFYTNWQVKKLDKAQALREAILATMRTHPNPRDWAAFTLIGEAE